MSGLRNFRIGPFARCGQTYGHLDGQRLDPIYSLGRAFGIPLLGVAADLTRQGHHAVLDFDADLRGMHRGLPLQLGHYILLQLRIGFHLRCSIPLRSTHHARAVDPQSVRQRTPVEFVELASCSLPHC